MSHPNGRSRVGGSSSSPRRARPALEGLEERLLLYATLGANWVYGAKITYSFAPDGTSVGGTPSTLFQTMDSRISRADWQKAFQSAAATWQAVAGINLVQVADNGQAFGGSGNQQGDTRFGDIRIGAIPLDTATLGAAFAPPPINGGTLAGDIVLNSTTPWTNVYYGARDLTTVAIHEFGHALGMDHSQVYYADMYAYYVGQRQSLNSDDVAGIQSIYGARPRDAFNSNGYSNQYWYQAMGLDPLRSNLNQIRLPNLDISYPGQTEWFWVTVPSSNSGKLTVQMQSTGLSSLTPAISVYDVSLNLKGTVDGTAYGDTATITVPGVSAGQAYFIRLSSSSGGWTGAYGMQVNFGNYAMTPFPPPYTVVASQVGGPGGFIPMTADVGAEPDEDLIRIGDLAGNGDALTVAAFGDRTASWSAFAAPSPTPGAPWSMANAQNASAGWWGGSWISVNALDDALSSWGRDGDDAFPTFGKQSKVQRRA